MGFSYSGSLPASFTLLSLLLGKDGTNRIVKTAVAEQLQLRQQRITTGTNLTERICYQIPALAAFPDLRLQLLGKIFLFCDFVH